MKLRYQCHPMEILPKLSYFLAMENIAMQQFLYRLPHDLIKKSHL